MLTIILQIGGFGGGLRAVLSAGAMDVVSQGPSSWHRTGLSRANTSNSARGELAQAPEGTASGMHWKGGAGTPAPSLGRPVYAQPLSP